MYLASCFHTLFCAFATVCSALHAVPNDMQCSAEFSLRRITTATLNLTLLPVCYQLATSCASAIDIPTPNQASSANNLSAKYPH